MKILIGGSEISLKSGYVYEYANGKRELRFTVLQNEITYDALKEVLAKNDGEILLTKDDETKEQLSGFTFIPTITDKFENDEFVFCVVIQCVAEAERKALEAKAKAEKLENKIYILEEQNANSVELEAELLYELSLMQLGLL